MRINLYLLALVFFLAVLSGLLVSGYHGFKSVPARHSGTLKPTSSVKKYPSFIKNGSRDKKVVALTFDADMSPKMIKDLDSGKVESWYNKKAIDILRENGVSATLFLSGMWIERYPGEAENLADDPLFELGNHSYSHPAFQASCYALKLIPDSLDNEEVVKTQKLLSGITGKENKLFRFPGGCYSKADLTIINDLGLTVVGWDVVADDSFNENTKKIVANVLDNVQNGSIVVLHMHGGPNAPKTAEALFEIVTGLKNKGYAFVKVSDLLE